MKKLSFLFLVLAYPVQAACEGQACTSWLLGSFMVVFLTIALILMLTSAFWVWMIVDCLKRDFKDKLVWILLMLFTHFFGASLYYALVKKKA